MCVCVCVCRCVYVCVCVSVCSAHSRRPWALSSSLLLAELTNRPSSSSPEDSRVKPGLRPLQPTPPSLWETVGGRASEREGEGGEREGGDVEREERQRKRGERVGKTEEERRESGKEGREDRRRVKKGK